ncbi:MAG: 50S ribosomal protein L31e [Candidatus Bathyarchaeia archaeon]
MSNPEKEEEIATVPETVEEEPQTPPVVESTPVESEVEEKPAESVSAAGKEEVDGEEEIEVVEEKTYTIPIAKLGYTTDRGHRAPRAVRDVKKYVSRHMKADEVSISNEINATIWARGINKPPRKIVVRAVKDKEGKVVVYPAKT